VGMSARVCNLCCRWVFDPRLGFLFDLATLYRTWLSSENGNGSAGMLLQPRRRLLRFMRRCVPFTLLTIFPLFICLF